MHILLVYKDYYPVLGGIENHVRVLAEGLAARGHTVTVLVTSLGAQDEVIRPEVPGPGRLTIIKAGRALHLSSTPLSPRMLWHARHLGTVDIAHLQYPYPPGDLAYLALPHRPPLIISYQSDIVRQRRLLQLYGPLLRWMLDHAARILASSPAYIASSPWLHPRAARCAVVPPSVDPERFAGPGLAGAPDMPALHGADVPTILFVGRLRYYKGIHFLLEALPRLRTPARLLLVGTGPETARLQAQVQALGLGAQVHFLGEVSDAHLPAIYHAADLFVLPSHLRAEAFGIVQLEAQSAGLPIVCTELGTGTSYITRHGQTGFVVPPADPVALARAIDVLLANPTLARQMGAAGQARARQEFSHTRMLDRVEAVYRAVLAEDPAPRR